MVVETEKSITKLEDYLGKKIQVVAFGTSYTGTLQKVNYEEGFMILIEGKDKVTLDLERIESFASVEEKE